MNRLSTELKRLYLPHEQATQLLDTMHNAPPLTGADGLVRSMVIESLQPAGWNDAATLWRGVQEELALPAPAIAVTGRGYQLWFSLSQAVSVEQAHEFLDLLRQKFLAEVNPQDLALLPAQDAATQGEARHARLVPFRIAESERWSAFVTPDLATLFSDEPWLDLPPGSDAQADLLARHASIGPDEFRLALQRLRPQAVHESGAQATAPVAANGGMATTHAGTRTGNYQDPGQFLLDVMNDASIDLRLRIEAAKALLPGREG